MAVDLATKLNRVDDRPRALLAGSDLDIKYLLSIAKLVVQYLLSDAKSGRRQFWRREYKGKK